MTVAAFKAADSALSGSNGGFDSHTPPPSNIPEPKFEELKEGLREASREHYDNLFDESYKRVHDAARELGLGDMFSGTYKLCSKLAHPTSLMVNMPEHTDSLIDVIYMIGEAFGPAPSTI